MWVGEANSLGRDGCVLALQEAGAGGHNQIRLPQQQAYLGGGPQVCVMGILISPVESPNEVPPHPLNFKWFIEAPTLHVK